MSKTLRQFQCRDDLWKRVEALAKRRGITPDDVLQAALLQLFKSKKKQQSNPPASAPASSSTPPPKRSKSGPSRPPASSKPPRRPPPGPPTTSRNVPKLPRPSGSASKSSKPKLPRPKTSSSARLPPPSNRAAPQQRPLYLCYESQWYVVDTDEFIIGRGAKYSDLPIKDANISRRHCAIVRRGADYFIKDLGSTNGIEFGGERVDNHKIGEGSTYFLCDHKLEFSFSAPA